MKIIGLGALSDVYEKALRYAFSLPICTAVVGMESLEQLQKNLAVAESFQPMTDAERLEFLREILPRVTPKAVPWKAEDWDNPVEWAHR